MIILVVCLLVAGPELGLAIELIALVNLFGLELILFCLAAPFWFHFYGFRLWLYKIDPYYFVPSMKQVSVTPGILAHAIPGYMPLLFGAVGMTLIAS